MPRPPTKNEYRVGARLILEEKMGKDDYSVEENAPVRRTESNHPSEAGGWVQAWIWVPLTDAPKLTHEKECAIDNSAWCSTCQDVHWREKEAS